MRETSLDELPVFESKRDGRIRRHHDLWDSPHGREVHKTRRRLINGILQKNTGKPWSFAWKELQTKVKGFYGETTRDLINWYVEYETWLENGVVMKQGMWGPEPVRVSQYGDRMTYYVDPADYTLKVMHADPQRPTPKVPEELPCKNLNSKYVRNGSTWFEVTFTPEQMKIIKTGRVLDADRYRENYDKEANSGDAVRKACAKKVEVSHLTNHRGFPPRWNWRYCLHDWKALLDQHLGQTTEAVFKAAEQLPRIYVHGLQKEPIQLGQLINYWVGTNPKQETWTPYLWDNNRLVVNPHQDQFKETMVLKPTVRPIGGKELDRIKAQIKQLQSYEN